MLKPLTVWITANSGKFLEMGILDHLTCLLRNLHAGQEVTELDIKQYWFKIGERVHQGCILSTYLFNLHAEYIMRNAGLNDSQAEIKIACLLSHVHLFATPWTVACQAPLSTEFSRQEYWSGLPFPSQRDLPDSGIRPVSPALAGGFFTTEPPEKPMAFNLYLLWNNTPKAALGSWKATAWQIPMDITVC